MLVEGNPAAVAWLFLATWFTVNHKPCLLKDSTPRTQSVDFFLVHSVATRFSSGMGFEVEPDVITTSLFSSSSFFGGHKVVPQQDCERSSGCSRTGRQAQDQLFRTRGFAGQPKRTSSF